jgi:hypothetical protein
MGNRQVIEHRPCLQCQRMFRPRPVQLRRGHGRYCSHACGCLARKLPARICEYCSKSFHPDPSSVKKGYARFCSRLCWQAAFGTVEDRFWKYVQKGDGCWLWTGSKNSNGYGQISARHLGNSPLHAHRLSWVIHFGEVPQGIEVCHNCDATYPVGDITYRLCVRPDHLWLGTHVENLADMHAKGRRLYVKSS